MGIEPASWRLYAEGLTARPLALVRDRVVKRVAHISRYPIGFRERVARQPIVRSLVPRAYPRAGGADPSHVQTDNNGLPGTPLGDVSDIPMFRPQEQLRSSDQTFIYVSLVYHVYHKQTVHNANGIRHRRL